MVLKAASTALLSVGYLFPGVHDRGSTCNYDTTQQGITTATATTTTILVL